MSQAIINQKRRVNIPQKLFFEAGFALGDRVRVTCDGYGRVVLERLELPGWAQSNEPGDLEPLDASETV
jgi:hypothetical protein